MAVLLKSADHDEVADDALTDLAFNRPHPRTIEIGLAVAVAALSVKQDAAVTDTSLPLCPGQHAPAVFHDESVVGILPLRGQRPPPLTADPNGRDSVDRLD